MDPRFEICPFFLFSVSGKGRRGVHTADTVGTGDMFKIVDMVITVDTSGSVDSVNNNISLLAHIDWWCTTVCQ